MWLLLILGALVLGTLLFLSARYVLRSIDAGKPGWGNPHARGELGARGVPGQEGPE